MIHQNNWSTFLTPSSGQTVPLTNRLLYVNGKLISLAVHRHINVYKYACYWRFKDRNTFWLVRANLTLEN